MSSTVDICDTRALAINGTRRAQPATRGLMEQMLDPASARVRPEPVLSRGGQHPVVFVHIPKAAGSTLNQIIARKHPPDEIASMYEPRMAQSVEKFSSMPEADRRKLRFVIGHVGFGLHQWLPGPATYATLLREPIDRIISYYYFVLRVPNHFLHEPAKTLGLRGFAECAATNKLTNGQTKYIAELDGRDADRATLEKAKSNIEKYFSVAGLVERFDESLLMLRRVAGWGIPHYEKENITSKRPKVAEVDRETLDAISRRNDLDLELYAWVKARFERQVADAGLGLRAEMATLKAANRLHRVYRKVRRRLRRAAPANVAPQPERPNRPNRPAPEG